MRTFSFLSVFLLAGLFLLSFADDSTAGSCGVQEPIGACVNCCKNLFGAGQFKEFDCDQFKGEQKKECQTMTNLFSQCSYLECLEEQCGEVSEVPQESAICEILDTFCDGD